MNAQITLVCVLIGVLIFERSYRLAKKHVALQHRVNVLEDSYKEATDFMAEQEKQIVTLQQELDFIRRTEDMQRQRERPRSWDPGDILKSGSRQ